MDQLSTLGRYQSFSAGHLGLAGLFAPHNEHRIPLPTLLYFIDGKFFDFTNRFLLFTIYASLAVTALIIGVLALRRRTPSSVALMFTAALGLAWSIVQYENLGWGFEVHFPLVHLFAVLCFTCVALSLISNSTRAQILWMLAAVIFDGLSIASLTTGLLTAAAALTIPVVLRRWNYSLVLFLAIHSVMAIAYFHNHPGGVAAAHDVSALETVIFFLSTMGVIAKDWLSESLTHGPLIIGTLLFVASAAAGIKAAWQAQAGGKPTSPSSAILLAIAAFVVIEAAAVTAGRVHNSHPDQAIVSRYATHSAVLSLAVLALYGRTFISNHWRAVTATAAISLTILSNMPFSATVWRLMIAREDRAVFAIMNGVDDLEVTDFIFPKNYPIPNILKNGYTFMQRAGKGPFAPSAGSYRPQSITLADNSTCRSDVHREDKSETTIKFSGWIADPKVTSQPVWILAYSDHGKLLGYTAPSAVRPDVQKFLGASDDLFGFELFLPRDKTSRGVRIVASFAPRDDVASCAAAIAQ